MKKLFVGNLDTSTSEDDLKSLFAVFGKVHSSSFVTDIFSRNCRGSGFVVMEDHGARAAVAGLDGKNFKGKPMEVKYESPNERRGRC